MSEFILSLRPASEADSEFCYQVKRASLGPYVAQVWGWDEEFQRELHCRDFAGKQMDIVVYKGKEIGTLSLKIDAEYFYIAEISLLPEYQRRGIGSMLLQRTIEEANIAAVPVRLQALKVNPARRLYERFGFKINGETETHFLMRRDIGPLSHT
jgi:ribosomal protein S18 acetylase RimI-like enzyme